MSKNIWTAQWKSGANEWTTCEIPADTYEEAYAFASSVATGPIVHFE